MTQSPNTNTTPSSRPWYQRESWLVVFLLAGVPLLLTMLGPEAWKKSSAAVTGVITVIGFVMMMRRSREAHDEERRAIDLSPERRD
jgi:dipeptide/tripeptide permease